MPITITTLKAAFPAVADPELEYKDDRLQTICDGLTKAGYNSTRHFQKTGTRQTLEKAEFSPADIEILVPGVCHVPVLALLPPRLLSRLHVPVLPLLPPRLVLSVSPRCPPSLHLCTLPVLDSVRVLWTSA